MPDRIFPACQSGGKSCRRSSPPCGAQCCQAYGRSRERRELSVVSWGYCLSKEQGERSAVAALLPCEAERHADAQLLRRKVDNIADQPDIEAREGGDGDIVGNERSQLFAHRVMHDGVAEQLRLIGRRHPDALGRQAEAAVGRRMMPATAAIRALLEAQLALF